MHTKTVTVTVNQPSTTVKLHDAFDNVSEFSLCYFKMVNIPIADFPPELIYLEIRSLHTYPEHVTTAKPANWVSATIDSPPSNYWPLQYEPWAQGNGLFGKQTPRFTLCDFRSLSEFQVNLYGPGLIPMTFDADTVAQLTFVVTCSGKNNLTVDERFKQYNKFQ